jgi:hypothetical protein
MTCRPRRRRRTITAALAVLLVLLAGTPAGAYLKIGTRVGAGNLPINWTSRPVRYFVGDRGVPGVTPDQFRDAAARAFATWADVPTSSIAFQFGGFTAAEPLEEDDVSTLGFLSRPELDRVLASTNFLIDTRNGTILEADIFFNSSFAWSVAEAGEAGRFDLHSIALHEAGHFLGLAHSALGETELRPDGGRRVIAAAAVMFPIAYSPGSIQGRELMPDDIAGASDIYPDSGFRQDTGSARGRVTKDGRGLFGAHVTAFDLRTGATVGGFTLEDDGEFVISGLRPGPHVIRVEPLDDGDVESFFDDSARVDVEFGAAFAERLAVVPRGGGSARIEIAVRDR